MKKSDGSDTLHLGDKAVISSRFHDADADAALGLGWQPSFRVANDVTTRLGGHLHVWGSGTT